MPNVNLAKIAKNCYSWCEVTKESVSQNETPVQRHEHNKIILRDLVIIPSAAMSY